MPSRPLDEPLSVDVAEGQVIVEGGDGIAFTMTPQAALETSDKLLHCAFHAIGMQKHDEWKLSQQRP